MAEIKSLLKEARKLIDEKSYKDAQECCKSILRKDKQNYLALVLLGKSLQDSDQAPLAYQKAIASKPDHALAWQGLASYYERKEENAVKIKLISIYNEILKLSLDEEKALEIITRLGQLGCSLKNNDAITSLINYINSKPGCKLKEAAEEQLLCLLKCDIICKESDVCSILKLLDGSEKDKENNQMLYGKIILQKSDFASAVNDIMNLGFFIGNVSLREWLCKQLCIKFVEENTFLGFNIDEHYNTITDGIKNSKYPGLLKSMIYFKEGMYLEAYKECVPLVNYQEADKTEAIFIIRCTIMLNKWSIAQKLATNFLMKVKDRDFVIILKKYLFESLYEQQKWKQAISIGNEIPKDSLTKSEQAALAKCFIETNEDAEGILDNLHSTEYFGQLRALTLIKNKNYNDAVTILEKDSSDNSINFFYLGQCYWELQQFDKCLLNLLKSAKLNAEHAGTFLYLGHFYYQHKQDMEKAKKCYEKAHSLNNTDKIIIKSLSEIYIKLNLKDLDFELLKAYQNKENETWLNFRLGLHYLNKREWENAILQFRNVIKVNQNNIIAFECLADAYYSRGSFTSALKAYKKVISLNPARTTHCLTQIGYIHCLLTEYEDAISTFEEVLKLDPSSVIALKGIAETWIKIAKRKALAKLFGAAREAAQSAVNSISKALSQEKRFTCFWNLLANTLIFVTTLPNKYCYVFLGTSALDQGNIVKVEKLQMFPQALACYSRVAKTNKQNSSYILALTYLLYYHASHDISNLHISYKLALACIHSNPSAWRNWNILGKICISMKKYDIAQHSFIKALLVTRKWSVAKIWCNIGTLYIILKLYKLANYCFWRGQSTLPSFPQSWIGQALIAEVIREEEAMDLYRHASRLGYHPESALGYVDWVCRTLKNKDYKNNRELKYVIDDLYAITYGIDLMEWFITYEPKNACALNMLGILQERCGLLQVALGSYQRAFGFAEEEKQNMIRLNIGRLLNRLEKYDDAIIIYKNITEASLDSTCGLALALFKNGLYEESYSAYDTALHWLSNEDEEKSDLLVAMAGIVYMFRGMDDAKTLLFHSIQASQKKPTPYSLFAICCLGILHSDQSLSKLALGELQKYERDSKYGYDIGFLKSYLVYIFDIDLAIKSISDSIHDHPSDASLWFCMSQYCLQSPSDKAKVASCCAQRAMSSDHNNISFCNTAKMLATASIAENIGGDKLKAMILAKKGLHLYPCQPEVWASVIFSLSSQNISLEKKNWTLAATNYMRKHLEVSRHMTRWITLLEKKLTVL